MAATVHCCSHPPFSIIHPSSSPSSSSSLGIIDSPLLPGARTRVSLRRVGQCNVFRAKCSMELEKDGFQLEPEPAEKASGINSQDQQFGNFSSNKLSSAILLGAALAAVELPALAVTGVNYEEDIIWVLIQLAIVAFLYFLVAPPIIMNWLRIRWYKRNVFEMYLQFMFVFIFFPGVLLWAPFLNFRKFPRDPSMKYPWSVPEDPSKVKNMYLKYPFAKPEDYEV